ncbi:MAG: MarR family winged helix-turn-helix transcriptional regulator [Methylococcaceae bacterium]
MHDVNTFKLIERISTLLRSEERKRYMAQGLQPIHGQILEYLYTCNRHSDTPAVVAEYFSLTKGTVSQSLQVLERKGYIIKTADNTDKRVVHLALSEAGLQLLEQIRHIDVFAKAEQALLEKKFNTLAEALTDMLVSLQQAHNTRSFGVCQSCINFIEVDNQFHCNLTHLALSGFDAKKICREHILKPIDTE